MTGVLEAWAGAVGETLNELAGFRFTRLTAPVAPGATTWNVESTFGWPSSGKFTAGGDVYLYTSKTDTTLTGVLWEDPTYAVPVVGRLTLSGTSVQAGFFRNATVRVTLTGTWTGSLDLESSLDGTTWATITSFSANQTYDAELGSAFKLRLKATSLTSGAVNVAFVAYPRTDGTPHPISGAFSAAGQTLNTVVLPNTLLAVTVEGTWSGTLLLEQSADGVAWTTAATITPVVGNTFQALGVAVSQRQVRLRASAWTSGVVTEAAISSTYRTGARSALVVTSGVVDLSKTYSAMEAQQAQFFVDTAVGEDLSTVGRNLGVRRPPDLADDDSFRKVIKALAYLPKGTMFGLELALEGFFGRGNYRVWEDFPGGFRNTVFIQILNGVNLATTSQGQAYNLRTWKAPLTVAGVTITLPTPGTSPTTEGPILAVVGARLADEGRYDRLAAVRPSALFETIYPGGPSVQVWTYSGTTEATVTSPNANTGLTITTTAGQTALYLRTMRVRPESDAELTAVVNISAASGTAGTAGKQWLLALRDGARDLAVGAIVTAGNVEFGFISTSTGAFLTTQGGPGISVPLGTQVRLSIRKFGSRVELWVDGSMVRYDVTASFPATTNNDVRVGHADGTYAVTSNIRDLGYTARTTTDYWNLSGTNGAVSGAGGVGLNTMSGFIIPADAGKALRTVNTDGVNPKNTGRWQVATAPDANNVTLRGFTHQGATLESLSPSGPHRVTVASIPDAFVYPYDVGKKLEVTDSGLGNNGTYVISQLMRVNSLGAVVPWGTPDPGFTAPVTPPPGTTHICELASAPAGGFVTETDQDWRLMPNWGAPDTTVYWELADAGTFTGMVLTLRVIPPINIPLGYVVVMEVTYSTVRSAQVLLNQAVANDPADKWFPLYMPSHPLGPYANFLKDLTKAGVIPEVTLG